MRGRADVQLIGRRLLFKPHFSPTNPSPGDASLCTSFFSGFDTMSRTGPTPVNDFHPDDGATLGEIVRYVMKHTRYTAARAKKAVIEVLATGIAVKKIIKTSRGRYALVEIDKPEGLHYRIRQPQFSDDDDDSDVSD